MTIPAADLLPLDSVATVSTNMAFTSPLRLAVVVLKLEIEEVCPPTVLLKVLRELAVAFWALVTVITSCCALAIAAVRVLPVKLVAPNTLTKVESRPATQALLAAFLV